MAQPLKQCPRTAKVAWCPTPAAPSLMALGSSVNSAAGGVGGDGSGATLDMVSFDPAKPGNQMEVLASVQPEGGLKFSSISWGSMGCDGSREGFPYGVLAGGLQEGVVALWNPHKIVQSRGTDNGLVHSGKIHTGTVHCVEFNPFKPNLMATAGADSEVNILDIDKLNNPDLYKPSANNKHAGSEVLCCAWNRKVPHILCSCSNTGATVVWDLRKKAEVITFQDPAGRLRCSDVAWHPEVPTQLIVAYDDDQQPSMQMWDLRHVQYPFKETQGHSKGILGVHWNLMDPNLLVSCGKDNKIITWNIGSGSLEPFGELSAQQWNFDVKWSPHKPGVISAASINGLVSIYSVQGQQSAAAKYCPKWYKKPCGVAMGFGGRVLSFGLNKSAAAITGEPAAAATTSYCHSLVVPNEPELIPEADAFETWIADRKLQEYCSDKTRQGSGNQHDALMWELMGCQFEETGRQRVPALMGFDQDQVMQKAEQYLGQKPGKLLGQPEEEEVQPAKTGPAQAAVEPAPAVSAEEAANIFDMLSAETEAQKVQQEQEAAQKAKEAAIGASAAAAAASASGKPKADWSAGPEAIIKQSLLVGNLTAAVECCFKNNRMAEGLLLASGGGTTLWTRARDEYLRLMGDSFLTTVGNIMTNDFDKLVGTSNLNNWKETLAVLATYSGDKYQQLCEQLAGRLEKETCDMLSAVICYICAGNFPKTVSIWANTRMGNQGSQKLALQDLVEKMAVLQGATKFNQADPLFNSKLTQYAEILANSGRLTAAMRYLTLLQHDASSAILRDRIYNSAPMQMGQLFGRAPQCPFQVADVRPMVQQQAPAQQQYRQPGMQPGGYGGPHAAPGMPAVPGPAAGMSGPGGVMPPRPGGMSGYPAPGGNMPPAPAQPTPGVPGFGGPQGGFGPGAGQGMGAPAAPAAPPAPPAPMPQNLGPAPRMGSSMQGPGMPPMPGGGMGAHAPGMPGQPGMGVAAPQPGMPPRPNPGMHTGPQPGVPGFGNQPQQQPQPGFGGPGGMQQHSGFGGSPHAGGSPHTGGMGGVVPPAAAGSPPMGGRPSTAPTAAAAPVIEGMPTPWPLPSSVQQLGSTTRSVQAANKAVQEASLGGGHLPQGEPMAAHELAHVKGVLSMLLDASSQDGNAKKREDIAKRLEMLYTRLQNGHMKTATSQKVLQLVKTVEAQDYASAGRLQADLSSNDWEANKDWITGLKRLIPQR